MFILMQRWKYKYVCMLCLGCVILTGMLAGCRDTHIERSITLTVSAAASLRGSLEELRPIFEREHPQVEIVFNFGSSGSLQKQIEQGVAVDLFLSAGKQQIVQLIEAQMIDGEDRVDFIENQLVVIVPSGASYVPGNVQELQHDSIRSIAVGEPDAVPLGMYTKQVLDHEQLWSKLRSKMVFAKDAAQVLTYVASGNVDAGFVYLSDGISTNKVHIAETIDSAWHDRITYSAAILSLTKHREESEQLLSFLQSKEAEEVFTQHGFQVPDTSPEMRE